MDNNRNAAFRPIEKELKEDFFAHINTPCYIIDEKKLRENGKILSAVAKKCGCKILLAQKAFSNYNFYNILKDYLCGTEASGLFEARLGYEEMSGKEVHVFSAAYRDDEFDEILKYADHIVFNSVNQLKRYGFKAKEQGKSIGLRINPECSTQDGHDIYDPCAKGSRLGVTRNQFDTEIDNSLISLLDGLHFHTLCEQNSDDLKTTVLAFEKKFSDILPKVKWVNMGGGHHITRDGYDIETLIWCVNYIKEKFGVTVYLEPGEAVALNSGFLATTILDIVKNQDDHIAIIDASAACHMPDVIEMPYTPPLYGASSEKSDNHEFLYRLAGPTCLSGDIVGDYYFKQKLKIGDLLIFGDMAIYTTCKNNTFNGMKLPDIYSLTENREILKITDFDYFDFKSRLGN